MRHQIIVTLLGGPRDGAVMPANVTYCHGGTMLTMLASPMRPDHLEIYWGDQPFDDSVPVLPFYGWQSKDIATEVN